MANPSPILRPNYLSVTSPIPRPNSLSVTAQATRIDLDSSSAKPLELYSSSTEHLNFETQPSSFEANLNQPVENREEGFSNSSDWRLRLKILIDLRLLNIKEDTNKVDLRGPDLALSWEWKNQVRLFLKANLLHLFEYKNNNIDFNSDFKIENFIDNAYIEFRNIDGNPFAIILGKRDLVLNAHDITKAIPIPYTFWENYHNKYDVIALSIKYKDDIELSIYEGENGDQGDLLNEGQGDFNIEEESLGFLLRITRDLNPSTKLTVAYNKQKNKHLSLRKPEQKITVSIQIEINDKISSWFEAMYLIENPPLAVLNGDKGNWGASLGLSYNLFDNLTLVGNYNNIDEVSEEFGLGFFMSCFFCSGRLKDNSQLNFQIYRSKYPEFGVLKSRNLIGLRWLITWDEVIGTK